MNTIEPLTNKINLIVGAITALLSYLLGQHWILFVFFLALNIGDFLTRWIAARITGTENSKAGWIGVLKKIGYWVMIALGFGMSVIFIEIGAVIGVDLHVTAYLGWFVLATLTINEIRSILENLVDAYGDKVPAILVKGLQIANKSIDGVIKLGDDGIETILRKPENEIQTKGKVTMEIEDNRTRSYEGTHCNKG
jgi:phage-related holin